MVKKKARLILQGFREPKSWDIGGIDSPVAAMASIRTLIFMAGILGDVISSIDVSTAFLQSDEFPPEQDARYVYYQPHKGAKRYYYRLKGCLYGQRSASMSWHNTISTWLKSQGFVPGKNDPCIYINETTGMRLALVVDDILCRGPVESTKRFYEALADRFDCKDPTYLEEDYPIKYVGLDIELYSNDNKQYISINQRSDVENYLAEIGFDSQLQVRNPMPNKHNISRNTESLPEDRAARYRSIVGAMNYYATALRYDIAYPASRLSQFSVHPTVGAEMALHRVLSYLNVLVILVYVQPGQ